MNCIEFRRMILAEPRVRSSEQQAHAARCEACAGFMKEIERLESRLEEAILVPVPESLAERVLLRRKPRWPAKFAAFALAASIALAIGLGFLVYNERQTGNEQVIAGATLGSENAAVAAISYVLDYEPQLLRANQTGDPAVMRDALLRLAIRLPEDQVRARYLGKCPVPGGDGEHVVLETPVGRVTLILVPNRSLGTRVVVDYRNRVAVSSPARNGSYILVADSLQTVRQLEQMLL
ncbi:MAG: DUF3379 family protein [Betaproteobacteria bacterium]|nr:DUF3379 family protein [Betaproteobacteria bacterium]